MKQFQFTLDSILNLRLEEEQEAEMRLGRAMGEWNRVNAQKETRLAIKRKHGVQASVSSQDLLQMGMYMARVDQEIQRYQRELDGMAANLEKLRAEYRAARAKREGLDKLKEKRKNEYNEIRQRIEAHTLDDLMNNMKRLNREGEL